MNIRQLNSEKRIIVWLNRKSGDKAARQRVIQVVRDIRALASSEWDRFQVPSKEGFDLLRKLGLHGATPLPEAMRELRRRGRGLEERYGPRKFESKISERLDSALKRFTFRPYPNLVRSEPPKMAGKLLLQMIPSGWNPPAPTVSDVEQGGWPTSRVIANAPSRAQEAIVVHLLVQAAGSGAIDRIRECNCGKWFLASRTDKRHCSEVCRKKFHTPSEEQRQRRREWQREYQKRYWKLNPSKRANSKASGGRKSPARKGGK